MKRTKDIDDETTVQGQRYLQNSFVVNLKDTSYLAVKTVVENGPYKVTTTVGGKFIRVNYFNKLEDAKDYSAFVLTHYPQPSQEVQLRITDIEDKEVEMFTEKSNLAWFNKTPEECQRLLPVEMMNSNLHRRSIINFNVYPDEYDPFVAKEYK